MDSPFDLRAQVVNKPAYQWSPVTILLMELYDFIEKFHFMDRKSQWHWAVAYKIKQIVRRLANMESVRIHDIQTIRIIVLESAPAHLHDVDAAFERYFQ